MLTGFLAVPAAVRGHISAALLRQAARVPALLVREMQVALLLAAFLILTTEAQVAEEALAQPGGVPVVFQILPGAVAVLALHGQMVLLMPGAAVGMAKTLPEALARAEVAWGRMETPQHHLLVLAQQTLAAAVVVGVI
jgi:hypothetical protein